jgi:hypothetical protein
VKEFKDMSLKPVHVSLIKVWGSHLGFLAYQQSMWLPVLVGDTVNSSSFHGANSATCSGSPKRVFVCLFMFQYCLFLNISLKRLNTMPSTSRNLVNII